MCNFQLAYVTLPISCHVIVKVYLLFIRNVFLLHRIMKLPSVKNEFDIKRINITEQRIWHCFVTHNFLHVLHPFNKQEATPRRMEKKTLWYYKHFFNKCTSYSFYCEQRFHSLVNLQLCCFFFLLFCGRTRNSNSTKLTRLQCSTSIQV